MNNRKRKNETIPFESDANNSLVNNVFYVLGPKRFI